MNTEYVKAFVKVYNSKNISAAAQSMFTTQSTVSRQIKNLEDELGILLFERGKGQGSVLPTPFAHRFLPIAQQMLSLQEQAFRLKEETVQASISIGVPDSIARYGLKEFFRNLVKEKKNWDISITINDSKPICDMVMDGQLDMGIINGADIHAELEARLIYEEPFVLVSRQCRQEDLKEADSRKSVNVADVSDSEKVINSRSGQSEKAADDLVSVADTRVPEVHATVTEVPESPARVRIADLDPAHEILYHCGDEFDAWHDLIWKGWQAKVNVNQSGIAVDCLTDEKDWLILPESTAKVLLPEDGILRYFADEIPTRKVYFILRKGLPEMQKKRAQEVYESACRRAWPFSTHYNPTNT